MAKRVRRETVRHHTFECDCNWCGYPMHVGDDVYTTDDGSAYCSATCAENDTRTDEAAWSAADDALGYVDLTDIDRTYRNASVKGGAA